MQEDENLYIRMGFVTSRFVEEVNFLNLCRREDLNLHGVAPTRTFTLSLIVDWLKNSVGERGLEPPRHCCH